MTLEEKTDVILRELYNTVQQNNGTGGIYPKILFEENGFELTDEELDLIIAILKREKFIVSQSAQTGKRIYFDAHDKGKEFVETTSFSQPGTSILNL